MSFKKTIMLFLGNSSLYLHIWSEIARAGERFPHIRKKVKEQF